ncbi:MAG: hypothetical protein GX654_01935 [Desulfatiglans sp.]|jgi:asparagine synthase (glutamine-hydrolysing)|nr:hypothetical protein [Desulfatiglans sp.]
MIGGYIHNSFDSEYGNAINKFLLLKSFNKIPVWGNGFFFFDEPFKNFPTESLYTDELAIITQDLLVKKNVNGEYDYFDLEREFKKAFINKGPGALNDVESDFRMAIAERTDNIKSLFLVSHRAGAGRIYYHRMKYGILFCSDLRVLLKLIGFDVNTMGIYSILKYGAIPEPVSISNNISVVPPGHYLKYNIGTGSCSTFPFFQFEFLEDHSVISEKGQDEVLLRPVKDTLMRSCRFLERLSPSILLSGGVDSSLYAFYLDEVGEKSLPAFYCSFENHDPELKYSKVVSERLETNLQIAVMEDKEALNTVEDVVRLTDHPFTDFSSLPVTFLLKYIRESKGATDCIIECNGGDDCFGFPALGLEQKYLVKHYLPGFMKKLIVGLTKEYPYWKWEGMEGLMARVSAVADVHELSRFNYFLVQSPVNYLEFKDPGGWNKKLSEAMEQVFAGIAKGPGCMSYEAKTTVRQLIHINSRLWSAKALSVGEVLGLKIIYPYIWLDILKEQGKLPWKAKIKNGIVKWPLKKLLEEYMPSDFIYRGKSGFVPPFVKWLTRKEFNAMAHDILTAHDSHVKEIVSAETLTQLLLDAKNMKKLRYPVLNFLWGAIFTEAWIRYYKNIIPFFKNDIG